MGLMLHSSREGGATFKIVPQEIIQSGLLRLLPRNMLQNPENWSSQVFHWQKIDGKFWNSPNWKYCKNTYEKGLYKFIVVLYSIKYHSCTQLDLAESELTERIQDLAEAATTNVL